MIESTFSLRHALARVLPRVSHDDPDIVDSSDPAIHAAKTIRPQSSPPLDRLGAARGSSRDALSGLLDGFEILYVGIVSDEEIHQHPKFESALNYSTGSASYHLMQQNLTLAGNVA